MLLVLSFRAADHHLVYVIDDPAIHMSMARQLTEHGTWGVSSGVYEAASSSPLWTLALAGISWVVPSSLNVLPLLLNALAGLAIVWVFASYQIFVTPRRGEPMSYLATVDDADRAALPPRSRDARDGAPGPYGAGARRRHPARAARGDER